MRKQSPKMSVIYHKWSPIRREFLAEMGHCCICGQKATCVDEICRGVYRMAAFVKRAAWLPSCGPCNCGIMADTLKYPRERKLALKALCDPLHYDVAVIKEILDPRPVDSEAIVTWIIMEHARKYPQSGW